MHQLVFQSEEWSLPMQWDQVVEPTGHPRRAKARMRRDLGDLGSALSAHGQPGENQSSSSLELECSLGLQYCAPGQSSCSLIYVYIIVYAVCNDKAGIQAHTLGTQTAPLNFIED